MSGLDHADAASCCAVDFPDVLRPERLMPHVSKPVSATSGPAKPANTPIVQCGQPGTETAVAAASRQPSKLPLLATSDAMQTAAANCKSSPLGQPMTVPLGATKMGSGKPSISCHPGRRTTWISCLG